MSEVLGKQAESLNRNNLLKEPKQDIEKLLIQGRAVQFYPQGYSMYPLFVPGRDQAVIAPADWEKLKRGDVVLYRRDESILVLHRIWKQKGRQLYMVGDNQKEIEGPLRLDQVRGVLVEIYRRGKHFSVKNPLYRFLSGLWLWLRPLRPLLSHFVADVKRGLRKTGGAR